MEFHIKITHKDVTNEQLLADIRRTAKKLKRDYISGMDYRRHGKYSDLCIRERFRRWDNAVKAAGLKASTRREETLFLLLKDIKSVSDRLGTESFSCYEYERNGKYTYAAVKRYFRTWKEAMKSAGLRYVKKRPPTKIQLLENLKQVWIALGRQPFVNEVKRPVSKIGKNEYAKRFGSWRGALAAFSAFINKTGHHSSKITYEKPSAKSRRNAGKKHTVKIRHRTRRYADGRLRFMVLERDGFRCCACGRSPATDKGVKLQVDHYTPWAEGGETVLENLQTLCMDCNIGKGAH